jgi:two-component system, OmpR family, manganese sensing sensor histidine kinase
VFQKTQNRLLLSYLIVLLMVLGGFAIAVRLVFSRILMHQLTDELTTLAQAAAAGVEVDSGQLQKIDSDFQVEDLNSRHQGLQWFNRQGQEVFRQGNEVMSLPFLAGQKVQSDRHIQGVTLPVFDIDNSGELVGYVRASQSLDGFDRTLQGLDWGLGGGVLTALLLSGLGGVWLTRQAMQPIEQSFQKLQQFTADASHELRNPLMEIKSNAAVALKYPEGMREDDTERFEAIANAGDRMTNLTQDLLFLARTDRVQQVLPERINLTTLLIDLMQRYQPLAKAKFIHLDANLTDSLYVMGHSSQLIQLFNNLVENALHYTYPNGQVKLYLVRESSYVEVRVEDTGVGIALEQLPQVFDRFWRADQSRSQWEGGAGLGLAIAQSIAQLHGGTITVKSQLGVGSCFTVRLPLDQSY